MLDGLLNRGFSSKCKSLMKATRTRIELVRKRAEAKQRFLKEDLAKLLANGLDINAYGRTEEFLAGLNLLSCYDFIEYACEYVLKQLSSMQRQRECPEECREPVASLMFAAARFSDLPELRDIRNVFQERYGSTLECFVNQKFVEILSSRPPVMEKRIQLLKDIASEFSINWNSGGFEQRMATPPTLVQGKSNKDGILSVAPDNHNLLNGKRSVAKSDGHDVSLKEPGRCDGSQKMLSAGEGRHKRREDGTSVATYDVLPEETHRLGYNSHRMHNRRGAKESERGDERIAVAKFDGHDGLPEKTRGLSNGSHRIHNYREDMDSRGDVGVAVARSERGDDSPRERRAFYNDGHGVHNHRDNKHYREDGINVAKYFASPEGTRGLGNDGLTIHKSKGAKESERGDGHGVLAKYDRYDVLPAKTRGLSNGSHRTHNYREDMDSRVENEQLLPIKEGDSTARVKHDLSFELRQEVMVDKHDLSCNKHATLFNAGKAGTSSRRKGQDDVGVKYSGQDSIRMHDGESLDALFHANSEMSQSCRGTPGRKEDISAVLEHVREKNLADSKIEIREEDAGSLKSYQNALLPPPYTKSKSNLIPPYVKPKEHRGRTSRKSELAGPCSDGHSMDPSDDQSNRIQGEPCSPNHEGQNIEPGRGRRQHRHEDQYYQDNKIPLPKPRSIRRRPHKSSTNHDDMANVEDSVAVKRSSSSRRRDNSRKGLQILFDDEHSHKDEEERMMDKLLLHYSKKPSTYGGRNVRKGSQAHPSHRMSNGTGESSNDRMRDDHDSNIDITPTTTRSISLPRQEMTQPDAKKLFTRANSFQPDGHARHVHPKLPDYDDLAARFAALKGR